MKILRGREPRIRAILAADFHLGAAPRFPGTGWPIPAVVRRRAFEQVVARAIETGAGLILLAGDVFDSPAPLLDDILCAAQALKRATGAGITVAGMSGDADAATEGWASPLDLLAELGLVVNLDRNRAEAPLRLPTLGFTVAISSLPRDPGADAWSNPLTRLDLRTGADFNFLATHHAVEGMDGAGTSGPVINVDSVRALLGVQALVSGHAHATAQGRVGDTPVVVPGSPVGAGDEPGGFVEIEFSARGIESLERVEGIAAPVVEIDLTAGDLEPEGAMERLKTGVESRLTPETALRIRLNGRASHEKLLRLGLPGLRQWASARAGGVEIDLSGLHIVGPDETSAPPPISLFEQLRRAATVTEGVGDEGSEADRAEALDLALAELRRDFGAAGNPKVRR